MVSKIFTAIVAPLASRKVRAALATIAASYLGVKFGLSEETIYSVISVGVAYILGVAHEDNGAKSATIDPSLD